MNKTIPMVNVRFEPKKVYPNAACIVGFADISFQ